MHYPKLSNHPEEQAVHNYYAVKLLQQALPPIYVYSITGVVGTQQWRPPSTNTTTNTSHPEDNSPTLAFKIHN
jgi:hypothetical protein